MEDNVQAKGFAIGRNYFGFSSSSPITVNRQLFTEIGRKGVPDMHPKSAEYKMFWKEERRRCVEGYSVGGVWMPGRLYFYCNYCNIEKDAAKSKGGRKRFGVAELRDVEWTLAYAIERARGLTDIVGGVPVYGGEIKGLSMITGRGTGKSYGVAGMCVAYEYTFFKNNKLLVSAEVTDYSIPHLKKVREMVDNLPGGITLGVGKNAEYFPPPFSHQRLRDDWTKVVESGYVDEVTKLQRGYKSQILHRIYKDRPTAANGLRVTFHVFEEVGMFSNLKEAYMASEECWHEGVTRIGTPILIGTGGDMEKGTRDISSMFFEPASYNMVEIEDRFEGKGKIGLFIPCTMGSNVYKDDNGFTLWKDSEEAYEKVREQKRKASDKRVYYTYIQNQPMVPSEAFYTKSGNIFPIADLAAHLASISNTQALDNLGQKGLLLFEDGNVKFRNDPNAVEANYPTDDETMEGCIMIYEHPEEEVKNGNGYFAGIDPYAHDNAEESTSLGSMFIFKRFSGLGRTYDIVVASYTGRPRTQDQWYENCRRLLLYYNARALYENMIEGFKQYLQMKNCLHLLYAQPTNFLKAIMPNSKVERTFGIHMTQQIKDYGERLINEWLLTEYEPGKLNLTKLMDKGLIKELIAYNPKDNFDRVMAFMMVMLMNAALYKEKDDAGKERTIDPFFKTKLFAR